MDENFFEGSVFRLRPGAVDCDGNGLRIAGHDLLRQQHREASHTKFVLPPIEELEERLWRAYGCRVSAVGKACGLQVVVDALNKDELARAQIAALLLKLPDPANCSPPALAKRLREGGWLLKYWEPDKHPRTGTPPNPGWFAPTDGGGGESTDAVPRSAHSAPRGELKPTETAANGGSEQQSPF